MWSYPAMLYFGLVAGVIVGNLGAHRTGIDAFRTFVATLILIPPAIIGARLLYVAAHWNQYRENRSRIWNRDEGGMAMFGGMPVMLLLSLPVLAALRLPFGGFWDVASLTVMTGMAFTKIGCLLNGCCCGRASQGRISMDLPNSHGVRARRIPVQLLEAAWAATVLVCASALEGRMPFPGAVFLIVAALYSTGRLLLEMLREREAGTGRFALGQWVSVVTVVFSVILLVVRWPR